MSERKNLFFYFIILLSYCTTDFFILFIYKLFVDFHEALFSKKKKENFFIHV